MFHVIEIKHKDSGTKCVITVPVTGDELFSFLWILEKSSYVEQFIVDNATVDEKFFGWGKFPKWVKEFTYKDPNDWVKPFTEDDFVKEIEK